ncbi:MAG TPA: M56 family metallopeptidase, partial [Opitutaceae bacterium]|nr:M56 family metallopeptidase [Opitutaceae bacterium]
MSAAWAHFGPALIDHLWQSTVVGILALLALAAFRPLVSARTRRTVLWLALAKFAIPSAALFPQIPTPALALFPVAAPARWAGTAQASLGPTPSPLLSLWAAGALIVVIATLLGRRRAGMAAEAADDATWDPWERYSLLTALAQAAAATGLRSPPALRRVSASAGPAIAGFSPTLLFPAGLEYSLSPFELRAVLLHECEHARRRDNLWAAFQVPFVAALWFHPLVWVLSRRIALESEMACDEAVLAHGVDAHTYVSALAKTVRHAIGLLPPGAAAAGATPLGLRLSNILTYRPSPPWRRVAVSVPLLLGLAASVGLSSYAGSLTRPAPLGTAGMPPLGNSQLGSLPAEPEHSLVLQLVSPPSDLSEPFPLDRPAPRYPALLRRAGVSGQAVVGFTVTA